MYLFIEGENKRESESTEQWAEAEEEGGGEESSLLSKEPEVGLDPKTPES